MLNPSLSLSYCCPWKRLHFLHGSRSLCIGPPCFQFPLLQDCSLFLSLNLQMGSSFQLLNSELAIYILAFVKTICFCFGFFLFFSFLSSITCTHPFYFKFSMLAIFLVGLSLLQISNRQIIINISQNELLSSSPLPS